MSDEFRDELRAWLAANGTKRPVDRGTISIMSELRDEPEFIADAKRWQSKLAGGGWGAIMWPRAYGGLEAGPLEVTAFKEELANYGVPQGVFMIGIGIVGPTIITHGTEEQKARYLPPMLQGEEIWCQLWSEPDAGSDLAGLKARAERDGDEFVLNGQKIWTSGAQYCQLGLGIFRSDHDAPKHRGISCFIVPMDSPGITIRPLKQMTGAAHFNEVFLDDVRIPASNLVGDLDDGWRVARTTLMNERMSAGSSISCADAFQTLAALARTVHKNGSRSTDDPVLRQELAKVYEQGRLVDLTTARVRGALAAGGIPGAEASILKLAAACFFTDLAFLAATILGPAGGLADGDAAEDGRWTDALLGSFAMHIGGGTDEIQRNIIGEAVLGLPREPAVDRDVPFRDNAGGTTR